MNFVAGLTTKLRQNAWPGTLNLQLVDGVWSVEWLGRTVLGHSKQIILCLSVVCDVSMPQESEQSLEMQALSARSSLFSLKAVKRRPLNQLEILYLWIFCGSFVCRWGFLKMEDAHNHRFQYQNCRYQFGWLIWALLLGTLPDLFRKRLADHPHQVHPLQLRTNLQIMSEWKRHFDAKGAWLGTWWAKLVRQLAVILLDSGWANFPNGNEGGLFWVTPYPFAVETERARALCQD